ncbi:MAG: hypothetical protein RJB62_1165 [Pseudomonadota bacterium]
MARLPSLLLLLTGLTVVFLYFFDVRFAISEDAAIQRELRPVATTTALDEKVNAALDRDDVEDAGMYIEIADYMDRALPVETRTRFANAMTTSASIARNTGAFATGFVTGEGTSIAGLAGAVSSDLTVVGDVRDIASEGTKLVLGQDYNEFILGLSVVGLAATGATVATGGGGLPAKLGVSIIKVAARAGTLTVDFARTLQRLARDAVRPQELATILRSTRLTDLRATEEALVAYARNARQADIFPVMAKLGELGNTVGPGETVRLLRYVRTTENLDDITSMSARLGKKTRGVIELTGKTSLRAFRTALNVFEFLVEWMIGFISWLATILSLALLKRIFRRQRKLRPA